MNGTFSSLPSRALEKQSDHQYSPYQIPKVLEVGVGVEVEVEVGVGVVVVVGVGVGVKKVAYFHGKPIALTDAQIRDIQNIGKRKPALKRAADKAWEKKGRET